MTKRFVYQHDFVGVHLRSGESSRSKLENEALGFEVGKQSCRDDRFLHLVLFFIKLHGLRLFGFSIMLKPRSFECFLADCDVCGGLNETGLDYKFATNGSVKSWSYTGI